MNKKLWLWISAVFALFAAIIITVELRSEYNFKKEILSSRLEGFADIVSMTDDYDRTAELFPDNIRVTVVKTDGSVIYDSYENAETLDNHLTRPEIKSCLAGKDGCSIRKSETAGIEYIYYARKYGDKIVRTALPFEISEKRFMHPDWMLLFSIALVFMVMVLVIIMISRRFNHEADRVTDQKLQSQKKHMTNNIAHELRTPVTSIRGYLETLVDNPEMDADKKALFTERAYIQTLRLSELIRDISLITKIEEAPELLQRESLSLRKVTQEVFDEFARDIEDHGIRVENLVSEDTTMNGNQSLVYAIIRNLVENSIRYAGDSVTVHLECAESSDGLLHLQYYDTGQGVPEEYLERIFERFYRVPGESFHNSDGSGLGLSIVRNAIAFHGGTIKASTMNPHGLCFTFTLKKY